MSCRAPEPRLSKINNPVLLVPPRSFAHATPGGAQVWKPAATSNQGTPWAARRPQPRPHTLVVEEPDRRRSSSSSTGFGFPSTPGSSSRRRSVQPYRGPNTPASMTRRIISVLEDVGSPRPPLRVRERAFVRCAVETEGGEGGRGKAARSFS